MFADPSQRRRVLVLAAALATVNLIAEVGLALAGVDDEVNRALGGVNTSDPLDGVFGLAAIVVVVLLLPPSAASDQISGSRSTVPD